MIKTHLFWIVMMIIPMVQAMALPPSALSKRQSLSPPAVRAARAVASATTLSTQPPTATEPPAPLRALSGTSVSAQPKSPAYEQPLNILVFSGTAAFRHMSLSQGIQMILDQAPEQNWIVTATTDGALFDDRLLPRFDVIIFLNPSGDALSNEQQLAFERFMKSGRGMVGIHSAADFEYEWPFYGNLLGAWFKQHPPAQEGTIHIESHNHPAMQPFAGMTSYTTFDEWYAFRENPREKVHVLATLDESSIKNFKNDDWRMGDHPIIWWQEKEGMRSFYSGFGHTHESFENPLIVEHLTRAINWAGKRE